MKPLIKWPGGKSREYKNIKDIIPSDINKYIEPFFGGGGIYFHLEPKESIINDINVNLMDMYRLLKEQNGEFRTVLNKIADDWNNLNLIAEKVYQDTRKFKNNIHVKDIENEINKLSLDKSLPSLINGEEHYWQLLSDGLIDKLNRVINLELKNGIFSDHDFHEQIIAVVKGAYYYYLRDKFSPKTTAEEVAQFVFLREYCFGSMFRFNKDGKFNIPYGGASYNNKDFHTKIDRAFSTDIHSILLSTEIHCDDFKSFFKKIDSKLNENDFCFFDPPYDTEFSEYDKHSFGRKDQEELAKIFGRLKCKGLMIIKKTDFIFEIYKEQQKLNSGISIDEYGKNYTYNVRGRNERDVTHLLITNYEPDVVRHNVQLSLQEQLSNNASV